MYLAWRPRLTATSVSTALSSSSSVSAFVTRRQPVEGVRGAAGERGGGGTGPDEEAARPRRRFLGGIPRLTLPSSLSSSPRNSIVAWHHAISSALYAFAPIDGKRHRSLKSTGRSKRVWNHALSVWATSGCARSSSSDKKMSRSAACAQRLVLMFAGESPRPISEPPLVWNSS